MWLFQWIKRNFKIVISSSFNFVSPTPALCEQFTHRSACRQHRRVSGCRTMDTRGFIFSCCETLELTSLFLSTFFSSRISYSKNVLNILNHWCPILNAQSSILLFQVTLTNVSLNVDYFLWKAAYAHLFCPVFDNLMNVLPDYQRYSG